MRHFFSFLNYVLAKRYFFAIKTCEDAEYFIKGCYIANTVYKQNDIELSSFLRFDEYVKNYYSVHKDKSWGKIIDFYSENETQSFLNLTRMVDEFRKHDDGEKVTNSSYIRNIQDTLTDINNFSQLLGFFYENYSILGISNIDIFDKFYFGYFSYGDYDKETQLFAPLLDKTFFDLHKPGNDFLKFLKKEYKIRPINSYVSIIKYMSGPNPDRSIETFIIHFKKFYPTFLKTVSNHPYS